MLATTGSSEYTYWQAYLRLRDEQRFEELKTFGLAGL
jgi:hypothetical protein